MVQATGTGTPANPGRAPELRVEPGAITPRRSPAGYVREVADVETHELRGKVMTPLGVVAQKWRQASDGAGEHFIGWYLGQSPITEERAHQLIAEGRPMPGPPAGPTTGTAGDGSPDDGLGRPRAPMTVGQLRVILDGLPDDLPLSLEVPGQRAGAPPEVDLVTVWIDSDHRRAHLSYRRDEGSGRPGTGE